MNFDGGGGFLPGDQSFQSATEGGFLLCEECCLVNVVFSLR